MYCMSEGLTIHQCSTAAKRISHKLWKTLAQEYSTFTHTPTNCTNRPTCAHQSVCRAEMRGDFKRFFRGSLF